MSGELYINQNAFKRRLSIIYNKWKNHNFNSILNGCDAIILAIGSNEDVIYSKSNSLENWLFGYELPDILIALLDDKIYFLASKKKAEFLKQTESIHISNVPPITILMRDKGDMDKKNFEKILSSVKQSKNGKNVGIFAKDKFSGDFVDGWNNAIKKNTFNMVDISNAFALMMAVKDESEINLMQKASQYTSDLFTKYFRTKVMEIVDQDKKVKHNKIASGIEEALLNSKYVKEEDMKQVEVCYNPIIQSGSHHNLKFSIASDKNDLQFDVITCCMGVRYKAYCSNIARTLLVNPPQDIQDNYNFLVEVEEELVRNLLPGNKLCDVYASVVRFVESRKPQYVEKLTKTFGFAIGIEFRESSLLIAPKCSETILANMTFNVTIGFSDLVSPATKKGYGLFVGDTVLVNPPDDGSATLMTTANKKFKHIAIIFKEGSDNDDEENGGDDSDEEEDNQNDSGDEQVVSKADKNSGMPLGRGLRKTVLESKLRSDGPTDDKRRTKQEELFHALNEEANRRLTEKKDEKSSEKTRKSNISYKSVSQMPSEPEIRELKLFVDKKHETVILPIFGLAVPFHISTIKNISQSVEGGFTYLRLNFFHPGAALGKDAAGSGGFSHPEANFVKEITYRSNNTKGSGEIIAPSSNLNTAFRLIKEVQKKFKTREAEEREMEGIVVQDKLVVKQGPNPRLKDLYIRPNLAQKRITGTLEAHANGLRYTSIRGDKVDILYNNIKHAFYQPCDHEMIILLHFHLKHGIILGKKKNQDIQFYTEVGEITTDLGKRQHMHDRDDLQSEQAERELRHKLNTAFKTFCDKVEVQCKQEIEFDAPFRELGFPGVPFRSTVLLQPTSCCLVNLVEWPPFVITLDEVELVHFERVQFHLKNFDMVFVFKDYTRKVVMINAVPMTMLDPVKEWLNSCDMYYTEGIQSLNWTKIMKTITDDPEGFFGNGGWIFLKSDSPSDTENGEEGESDEEEDSYQPTDSDADEDSSDDDEDDEDYSEADSDESGSGAGSAEGESEESGKDWDELEAEAAKADRERDLNDFEDDRHPAKKKVGGGGARSNHHSAGGSNNKRRSDHSTSQSHNKKVRR